MLLDTTKESSNSRFEVSVSIMGNEFVKVSIFSESKYKNWAFFGILALLTLTYVVTKIGPDLVSLYHSIFPAVM